MSHSLVQHDEHDLCFTALQARYIKFATFQFHSSNICLLARACHFELLSLHCRSVNLSLIQYPYILFLLLQLQLYRYF
jgi:hypothetical protein